MTRSNTKGKRETRNKERLFRHLATLYNMPENVQNEKMELKKLLLHRSLLKEHVF